MHNNTILFWDQIQMIESIDLEMIAHFIDQKKNHSKKNAL